MATETVKMVLKLDDKASGPLGKVGDQAGAVDKSFGSTKVSAKQLGIGLVAAGAAAIGAAKAFVAMGQDFADQINLFNDMSTSTGLTVQTLESLNLMARATGVNLSGMERGLVSFQRNLGEAKEGTGTLTKALETLQLDPSSFEDTDDALRQVLASIAVYGTSADQAKLLNEAFGISAKDMAKVMQTQFSDASQAIDLLGVSITDSREDAAEAQRGLALYELVLKRLKQNAFDAFLGGGGFAEGLSVVVGIAKGLISLLESLGKIVVGFLAAVGQGIESLALLLAGEVDAAYQAGVRAQESVDMMAQGLVDVVTLKPIQEGVEAALDLQEALEVLGGEVETDADLMTELAKQQDAVNKATNRGTSASKKRANALKMERQEWEALAASALRANTSVDQALGKGISGALEESGASLELMNRQVEAIASASASLIAPMTDAQRLLTGTFSSETVQLTSKAADEIENIKLTYTALSQLPGSVLGLEDDIADVMALQEQLASLVLVIGNMDAKALEMVPKGSLELLDALKKAIEEGTQALEIKAGLAVEDLIVDEIKADKMDVKAGREDIGNAISAGFGAVGSMAQGDVGGAAAGIASAIGDFPVFGAIASGLSVLTEIGQMTVAEIKANTRAFITNLMNGIQVLAQALPDIITMLLTNLPAVLVEAAFTWIPQLLLEMPLAITKGFVEGIKNVLSLIVDALKSVFSFGDPDREGLLDRIRVDPSGGYATGIAKVNRTGMALIHKGESIIPAGGRAQQTQAHRTGGGAVNINISTSILDRDVIPRLVKEIDRVTGNYGRIKANFAGA